VKALNPESDMPDGTAHNYELKDTIRKYLDSLYAFTRSRVVDDWCSEAVRLGLKDRGQNPVNFDNIVQILATNKEWFERDDQLKDLLEHFQFGMWWVN
jgi:hypothetical protein